MGKETSEVRQDGLLYIDRDKAVQQHLEALRTMIRPGNVQTTSPSPSQLAHSPHEVKPSK